MTRIDSPVIGGYDAARVRGEQVAQILANMARLVGEPDESQMRLGTGVDIRPGLGLGDDAALLAARARDLGQGLFTIIVLGEFKNGKSTLLNGMLGNKTLPAKAAPATAIITVLVHGDGEEVAIYEVDRLEPRLVSWDEFLREFQLTIEDSETLQEGGTLDRFREVRYAQIETQHPLCANGVKLVDSPGLGEHISRTRVATNFLRQSQAVIFVLNATRILGQSEREFIEDMLGRGSLSHVFFVVNRMDGVVPSSHDEIRAWVERALTPHFEDDEGGFDRQRYERRVFFISAKQALDARLTRPVDEALLAASGVPALEAELERFLASDEKITAALQSTVGVVAPILAAARRRIEQHKSALDQPLEELERRRAEGERRLEALQGRRNEIERTILLFGDVIRRKVYSDLRSYIGEMHESWAEDSRQIVDLDGAVSLRTLLTSYAQGEAKQRMASAIEREVQRYLQIKFGRWLDRVPAAVQRDVETMIAEVEGQVEDFQLELADIAGSFSGETSPARASGYPAAGAGVMELALTLEDISGMTDSIMYPSDWTEVVGRMAQQAVAVFLVGTFLTGGNFLIALLAVEAVQLGLRENEVKRRIREEVGERLHAGLLEQVEDRRGFVYESVERRFQEFARVMTRALGNQIRETGAEQERVLRQRRERQFSVEGEKQRLDAIAEELTRLDRDLAEVTALPRSEAPTDG